MRVGYARVSIDDPTPDLQPDALERLKCWQIYERDVSGIGTARPQLEAWKKPHHERDVLIVWRLNRLGRSLVHLIRLTQDLHVRGIAFASVAERIYSRSPTGPRVLHMFGALAELERNLNRERTLAGLGAARARGPNGGRPQELRPKDLRNARALLRSGDVSVGAIAEQFYVARSTLYSNVVAGL